MYKTGNETTDKLIGVEFSGNIIHSQWYKTILKKNGKADIVAINILADIVYWYRPTEVRKESTGQIVGYKKKYKADLLQRTYESYADQFGLSKKQVTDAVKRLEELKLIKRIFRNITTESGMFLANVLYFELDFDELYLVSFVDTIGNGRYVPTKKEIPLTQKVDTYTNTTTNITTENNNVMRHDLNNDVARVVDNFSDDGQTVYDYFIDKYFITIGCKHPLITQNVVDKINSIFEDEYITDPESNRELSINVGAMCDMIDWYFDNNNPLYGDRKIYHFLSPMILKNLYNKVAR